MSEGERECARGSIGCEIGGFVPCSIAPSRNDNSRTFGPSISSLAGHSRTPNPSKHPERHWACVNAAAGAVSLLNLCLHPRLQFDDPSVMGIAGDNRYVHSDAVLLLVNLIG